MDFGNLLFKTKEDKPSVILFRCADHAPMLIIPLLIQVVDRFTTELATGSVISVDERSARVRALPFK